MASKKNVDSLLLLEVERQLAVGGRLNKIIQSIIKHQSSDSAQVACVVDGTAAGMLLLMHLHKISLSDIIDAIIDDQNIIGVGLITLKDQLNESVDKHLK